MSELKNMRARHKWPFPASDPKPSVPFGLDEKTFPTPRFHPAVDIHIAGNLWKHVLDHPLICPCPTVSTKWWGPRGASGTTWLDLRFNGGLWRFAHLSREEMNPEARALIIQGLPLDQGQEIGPSGEEGLSLGRHLHAMLYLEPTDENIFALSERWGDLWGPRGDKSAAWGPLTNGRMDIDGWTWANRHTAGRKDPFDHREYIAVDWLGLLWPERIPSA